MHKMHKMPKIIAIEEEDSQLILLKLIVLTIIVKIHIIEVYFKVNEFFYFINYF